jgi:hypothetical protein
MTVKQARFSISNIEDRLRDPEQSDEQFAESIGASRSKLKNWRRNGIRLYAADRLAISLGHHPSYFWPEYWDIPTLTPQPDIVNTQEEL